MLTAHPGRQRSHNLATGWKVLLVFVLGLLMVHLDGPRHSVGQSTAPAVVTTTLPPEYGLADEVPSVSPENASADGEPLLQPWDIAPIEGIGVTHHGVRTNCGGLMAPVVVQYGDRLGDLVADIVNLRPTSNSVNWATQGAAIDVVAEINKLANPAKIRRGQHLRLPQWCSATPLS